MMTDDVIIRYIKTKNKTRKIYTYANDDCILKSKHIEIADFIEKHCVNSIFAKAYVVGQSIFENAKAHMYNDFFIMLDIKDFFNSINHNKLVDKLYYELNSFDDNVINKLECAEIVELCCVNSVGLPIGFVTSPILSNIYLKDFDGILYGNLKKMNLDNPIYTRYADDLCISFKSSDKDLDNKNEIISLVQKLLKRYSLKLNEKKSRFYNLKETNHVKVTGVNIVVSNTGNRLLTVGNKIKNDLFWDAINYYKRDAIDEREMHRIKGMQSFILSVEKNGYESCYSDNMMSIVHQLGFTSLKSLIDSL